MTNRQTWDPERYARNARFVSDLGLPVVNLLAPRPGERILDLGCGDGVLAAKLVEVGCDVVGITMRVEAVTGEVERVTRIDDDLAGQVVGSGGEDDRLHPAPGDRQHGDAGGTSGNSRG